MYGPDARSAAIHADRQQHDHPILGSGRTAGTDLIGDQVALAEHDQLAVDDADGLDDMHVLVGDRGDIGRAGKLAGEAELKAAGLDDILIAPMSGRGP